MRRPVGFRFVNPTPTASLPRAQVVPIVAGVRSKRALLACYACALDLPDYFGWNWDALEECLSDLAWLAPPRRVRVVHADVPFARHSRNRTTYLSLLCEVTATNRQVTALFPVQCEEEILRLLARAASED